MSLTLRWYQTLAWKFFLRSVLTLLAAVGIILWVAFDQAQQGAQSAGQQALRNAGQVLDRQIRQETRILDAGLEVFVTQSANPSYLDEAMRRQDPASARDYLKQSLENLKADFAFVVGSDGRPFAATLEGLPPQLGTATASQMALDPDAALEAGRKGPSYMGFAKLPQEGLVLVVTRTLRLPGGTSVGALGVGLRLGNQAAARFREAAIGTPEPPAHLALMAGGQAFGSTLGEALGSALQQRLQQTDLSKVRSELEQGRRSVPLPLLLGGRRHLAMFSPLRGEDGASLETATLLVLPLDPYLKPFQRIQMAILGAGAVGLLLALLAALASARSVTAPLARLTDVAQALAEGQRPDLAERPSEDEVGALTRAFRSLLSDLQAKDELLGDLARLRAENPTEQSGILPGMSRMSLPVVDLDATAYIPDTSRTGTLQPTPRRLSLREGEVLAERYRIEAVLGRGGMGVVLKAHDLQLDEDVALKVIRPELALTPAFLEQLKQELRLARRITHRHVLRTHDFGEAQGIPFVTMEFLKGITLRQLSDDRGRLPLALTLRIARQVAEGLEAAHAVGVVHRDVKPHNVFFDLQGDVKLLDFGLAAPVAAAGGQGGHIFGTPRYMAPEQVRGEAVDPRTDLYALGVMLFELACGRPPFDHNELTELLRQHLEAVPPSLQSLAPEYPAAFVSLVNRLLAKRQAERPSSATEVVALLKMMGREADGTRQV